MHLGSKNINRYRFYFQPSREASYWRWAVGTSCTQLWTGVLIASFLVRVWFYDNAKEKFKREWKYCLVVIPTAVIWKDLCVQNLPANSFTQWDTLRYIVPHGLLEKYRIRGVLCKIILELLLLYFCHQFSLGNSWERNPWVNHLHLNCSKHLVFEYPTQKWCQATANQQYISGALYLISWKRSETIF